MYPRLMRVHTLVVLCIVTASSACGGEERETEEPTAAEPATAEPEEDDPPEGPTPPRPPESMVQQLLGQLVLDHSEVRQYLHTEIADNVPLTVHAVPELAEGAAAPGGCPAREFRRFQTDCRSKEPSRGAASSPAG